MKIKKRKSKKEMVFDYLDQLKKKKMLIGARRLIQDEFGVNEEQASELLIEWMEMFGDGI